MKFFSVRFWLFVLIAIGCILFWWFKPFEQFASREAIVDVARQIEALDYAPLYVVAAYVVGSLVLFPVTVLIFMTALALPPSQSFFSGVAGVVLSGMTGYYLGRLLGRDTVSRLSGTAFRRVNRFVSSNGVVSVTIIRNLPLAPFSIANMIIGSLMINPFQFAVGNVFGLGPGLLLLSLIGYQAREFILHPKPETAALMISVSIAGIVIAFLSEHFFRRLQANTTSTDR